MIAEVCSNAGSVAKSDVKQESLKGSCRVRMRQQKGRKILIRANETTRHCQLTNSCFRGALLQLECTVGNREKAIMTRLQWEYKTLSGCQTPAFSCPALLVKSTLAESVKTNNKKKKYRAVGYCTVTMKHILRLLISPCLLWVCVCVISWEWYWMWAAYRFTFILHLESHSDMCYYGSVRVMEAGLMGLLSCCRMRIRE